MGFFVSNDIGNHRLHNYRLSSTLNPRQKYLETQTDWVQISIWSRSMGKSLFERIHLDFLPSIQWVSRIPFSNTLNSHIGEDSCHIWTDINSTHSFFQKDYNRGGDLLYRGKPIIEKSHGGRFLWNRNWDLGWIWARLATFEARFFMWSWARKLFKNIVDSEKIFGIECSYYYFFFLKSWKKK